MGVTQPVRLFESCHGAWVLAGPHRPTRGWTWCVDRRLVVPWLNTRVRDWRLGVRVAVGPSGEPRLMRSPHDFEDSPFLAESAAAAHRRFPDVRWGR